MNKKTIEQSYIDEFIAKAKYRPYKNICKSLLIEGKPYSLNSQMGWGNADMLRTNIPACVKAYSRDKDNAIRMFRELVEFLKEKGVQVDEIQFPPIPVSNSFERLMYIAKYLQEPKNRIAELEDNLWVSSRQIEEDLRRLRGVDDPIQVCGKSFYIPDTERRNSRITFASTAHPIFLTENLTQVLVTLKGLKLMAEDPAFTPYAEQTGAEIWNQLSNYAKERIRFVLGELLPEDLSWYESLSEPAPDRNFHTEEMCGRVQSNVVMDSYKNGKSFCVEYDDSCERIFYKDCHIVPGTLRGGKVEVETEGEKVTLILDQIVRSAYTIEELASD